MELGREGRRAACASMHPSRVFEQSVEDVMRSLFLVPCFTHMPVDLAAAPTSQCIDKSCLLCSGNPSNCTACKGRLEAVNGTCVLPAAVGGGGALLGKVGSVHQIWGGLAPCGCVVATSAACGYLCTCASRVGPSTCVLLSQSWHECRTSID